MNRIEKRLTGAGPSRFHPVNPVILSLSLLFRYQKTSRRRHKLPGIKQEKRRKVSSEGEERATPGAGQNSSCQEFDEYGYPCP